MGGGGPSSSSNGGTADGGDCMKDQEYDNVLHVESCARIDENGNIDPEQAETMLMTQQQDKTFEDLDMAVTRVGYIDETIHEEIHTQNMMGYKIN